MSTIAELVDAVHFVNPHRPPRRRPVVLLRQAPPARHEPAGHCSTGRRDRVGVRAAAPGRPASWPKRSTSFRTASAEDEKLTVTSPANARGLPLCAGRATAPL